MIIELARESRRAIWSRVHWSSSHGNHGATSFSHNLSTRTARSLHGAIGQLQPEWSRNILWRIRHIFQTSSRSKRKSRKPRRSGWRGVHLCVYSTMEATGGWRLWWWRRFLYQLRITRNALKIKAHKTQKLSNREYISLLLLWLARTSFSVNLPGYVHNLRLCTFFHSGKMSGAVLW